MTGFTHTYEDQAQAAARENAAEMAQTLTELGQWQNCILTTLGIMIRGGASKATLDQIDNATKEYSIRFQKIMDRVSAYRLAAPNRY